MEQAKHRILLVNDEPGLGETRCMILRSHGFAATCAGGLAQARSTWQPKTYDLVLVDVQQDPDQALGFCEELKEKDARQLVALISRHHVWVPPSPCPDDVIATDEGPRHFVQRIKGLLESDSKAAPALG